MSLATGVFSIVSTYSPINGANGVALEATVSGSRIGGSMNTIMGGALIALSLTMIAFSQWRGYVPVSFPKYRVYRNAQPAYFWTLIIGYALVGMVGIRLLIG